MTADAHPIPGVPRRAATRPAAWLALALPVGGCALGIGTPPSVDVLAVRLVAAGLTEQRLAMTLCVTNPNPAAITFRRVAVALDVSGSPLAAGATDLPVSLPPMSSTPVPVTVDTTVRNLGPQLLAILRDGTVDYRLHGTVTLAGGIGLTLPFSRSGQFDPVAGGLDLVGTVTDPAPGRCPTAGAVLPRT